PGCGEVDIMEQTGQDKTTILGTLHYPAVSPGAGNGSSVAVGTGTTEFHNYTLEWTPDEIFLLVDDEVYHSVPNTVDLPFHSDFFLILNVALGGTLGGDIDPAFTEDVMEVDYVRVYQ
ncbi:MAG TPA: glycoside hydrolase family 16 protein, partial [Flavobacteriaceae bacterium]|nr:glycoside hydrolase family 16 protein [Flavobacteriaceae bacterium]